MTSQPPPLVVTPLGADLMNTAITYTNGPFSGKTIRTQLQELQSPKLGRKYASAERNYKHASADRRAVDPPAVVTVRYFEQLGPGTEREIQDYSSVDTSYTLCSVLLYKVDEKHVPSPNETPLFTEPETGIPVYESCLQNSDEVLYGSTSENPNLIKYNGKEMIVFAFPDISVRHEGMFLLSYKTFDTSAQMLNPSIPGGATTLMQAQCFGGVFKIYASKKTPALPRSTSLTRTVATYNNRVHVRHEMRVRTPKKRGRTDDLEDEDGARSDSD